MAENIESGAKALAMALQFERDGREYFLHAKERVGLDFAKSIMQLLADEELKHIQVLETIHKELEEGGKIITTTVDPLKDYERIFEKDRVNIPQKFQTHSSEKEILVEALGFEEKGASMYMSMSNKATDPNEKAFFKALSIEEQKHFDLINNYLNYYWDHGMRMNE